MPTMAEPQAKRLKRCHDEVDDSASSSTASSVPRATYAPRKSTVSPRDTKATLLQHITHLEEEKTAAQARLEQENRLLKSLLNQPEKIPAVEEYLARFMADRNATSYHELWEDMEKVRAQNSCLLRECERLRYDNWRLQNQAPPPVFTAPLPNPALIYAHQVIPHHQPMPHQALQHQPVPHQSIPHQPIPHQLMPHQSMQSL
ncbi:hypothetical protein K525DRAFT_267244 [Schizophyllum commune Loenen D]|nr:hypothetical protein K525DRAFT_267244 [Schizophyllum commune Loenen D]